MVYGGPLGFVKNARPEESSFIKGVPTHRHVQKGGVELSGGVLAAVDGQHSESRINVAS